MTCVNINFVGSADLHNFLKKEVLLPAFAGWLILYHNCINDTFCCTFSGIIDVTLPKKLLDKYQN